MKRVRLMLDPDGSALGKDIPAEDIENMTEEEKKQYESDLIMRGMGNSCLRKFWETMLYAGFLTAFMYYTGLADVLLAKINPEMFPRKDTMMGSYTEPTTLAELDRSEL